MIVTVFALIMAVPVASPLSATETNPSSESIPSPEAIEMMRLSKGIETIKMAVGMTLKQRTAAMVRALKKDYPDITKEQINAILQNLRTNVMRGLNENEAMLTRQFSLLYDRHFTPDELRQINAFYQTPVGRKSLKKIPMLMQEGMVVSQVHLKKMVLKAVRQTMRYAEKTVEKP
ncbi:MAG: DUF2059 domain-containing protein [Magnetococcales bacterium]|nr:DUF2059 domain-containing protein [Magnetococcales bacterium]